MKVWHYLQNLGFSCTGKHLDPAQKTLNFRGEIRPRRIGFNMIPLNLSFNSQLIKFEFFKENNSKKEIDETIRLDFSADNINVLRTFESLTNEIKNAPT